MILKVNGKQLTGFNRFTFDWKYNAVASGFNFTFLFDPVAHKDLFKPCSYLDCTMEHNDELLLTGTILSHTFSVSNNRQMITIAGYSKPGVLEDCQIPISIYPLQSDGLSLKQIAQKLIKPFGLGLVVENQGANTAYHKDVKEISDEAIDKSTAYEDQSIVSYLLEIAAQKNVTLSHDNKGNLILTRAKTSLTPILDFNLTNRIPGTSMSVSIDGQSMHSSITVQKQADSDGGNAAEETISNPFVTSVRPSVTSQSSGTDVNTKQAARNALSKELSNIKLTINTDRWEVDGKIIKPNNALTVLNPDLYLYKKTKWFIESIKFDGDEKALTATINCVLPSVYDNSTPVNIFN